MGANQNPLSFLAQAGMSDFGLTQPSQTNSLSEGSQDGANVPDLQQLLSSSLLDAEEKARMMSQQMEQLRGQETQGVRGRMFGTQGAITGLAALAGGLISGRPEMALGIAGGGVDAMKEAEAQERTALKEAYAAAASERDAALDRADKERNRLATMFNTNPEAFVDPNTGEPVADPQALGYLLTGTDLPIHPTTRRVMTRRDENRKAVTGLLTDALEAAQSIPQARQVTNELFRHLGDEGQIPGGVKDSLIEAYGTPEFEREFASVAFRYGGQTGLDAAIEAGRRGVPLHHPDILEMMDFSQGDVLTPTQKVTDEFLKLSDRVRLYQTSPTNADIVAGLRESAEDTTAFNRALVEKALPLAADQMAYFKGAGMIRDMSFDQWQAMYNDARGKYSIVDTIGGVQVLEEVEGLEGAEREAKLAALAAGTALQTHERQVEESQLMGANQVTSTIAKGASRLVSLYPISEPMAGQISDNIYTRARKAVGPDRPVAEYQAKYEELLEQYIANNQ
jgi:hypothetical protein